MVVQTIIAAHNLCDEAYKCFDRTHAAHFIFDHKVHLAVIQAQSNKNPKPLPVWGWGNKGENP